MKELPQPVQNLKQILNFIEKKNYKISKLVVITKNHTYEKIQLLYDYGHRDFGENKYQEARDKFPLVKIKPDEPFITHHVGPLQSGNARNIPQIFDWIHGAGSVNALQILEKASLKNYKKSSKRIHYLIQLNLTREPSKLGGFFLEDFESLFERKILPTENEAMIFKGFMTMGPSDGNLEISRKVFKELRKIRDQYKKDGELSMGMSGDWQIALEEGATILRIGTAILGNR